MHVYINILHLLWIVPVSAVIGMWFVALVSANRDMDTFELDMSEDEIDKWTL